MRGGKNKKGGKGRENNNEGNYDTKIMREWQLTKEDNQGVIGLMISFSLSHSKRLSFSLLLTLRGSLSLSFQSKSAKLVISLSLCLLPSSLHECHHIERCKRLSCQPSCFFEREREREKECYGIMLLVWPHNTRKGGEGDEEWERKRMREGEREKKRIVLEGKN